MSFENGLQKSVSHPGSYRHHDSSLFLSLVLHCPRSAWQHSTTADTGGYGPCWTGKNRRSHNDMKRAFTLHEMLCGRCQ